MTDDPVHDAYLKRCRALMRGWYISWGVLVVAVVGLVILLMGR